ncbi:hypothetical protein BS47DRAFT_1402778 [Hydnum rufescens UP504]|uniref:Uncharacterized protein n=1 Tax=Hydnum rufescens UP504 TaxID=1448309 RepID=A0A9P6ABK1_9AGAM|nr:hypothetical protein BS47DRAFT_1402778 [Hydnum rufescens UP504]
MLTTNLLGGTYQGSRKSPSRILDSQDSYSSLPRTCVRRQTNLFAGTTTSNGFPHYVLREKICDDCVTGSGSISPRISGKSHRAGGIE